MEEKKRRNMAPDYTAWIIRWINPYGLECKSGRIEDVRAYAEKKAQKTGNSYLIF